MLSSNGNASRIMPTGFKDSKMPFRLGALMVLLGTLGWSAFSDGAEPPPFSVERKDRSHEAKQAQADWADFLREKVVFVNSKGMSLNLIPPGEFNMGRTETAKSLNVDFPRFLDQDIFYENELDHRVRLSKPFRIGATEVTQKQWKSVMGSTPWLDAERIRLAQSSHKWIEFPTSDELPVGLISAVEAANFCETLSQIEHDSGVITPNQSYALPTEAQWEYACQAGSVGRYYFGDDPKQLEKYAWFGGATDWYQGTTTMATKLRGAQPVAQKLPNVWGLYDMHGNLSEYVSDKFAQYDTSQTLLIDPFYPPKPGGNFMREFSKPRRKDQGDFQVCRGGSWLFDAKDLRSVRRGYIFPTYRGGNCQGFRVVLNTK